MPSPLHRMVLPLAGGLVGLGLDNLQRRERRDPAVALAAGVPFALAYLGACAGVRAAAGR